jgi:hypothetical protein
MGGEVSWPSSINGPTGDGYGLFRLLDTTGLDTGSGSQVAFLGDVNGDGIGDFALTVPDRYAAFIVFGQQGLFGDKFSNYYGDLDGSDGFRIDFPSASDYERPTAMVGADVNRDGINDILIAVASGDSSVTTVGHVIFGKKGLGSGGLIDLSTGPLTPPDGFSVHFASPYYAHYLVTLAVGDVNGDGYKDLAIGIADDPYAGSDKGRVYVIFSPKPQ